MFKKYLRGGALYLAIFISLIIAVLLSMLLLHSYYSAIDFRKFSIRQSVHRNMYSAFNYASSESFEPTNEPLILDLYENQTDSVEIVKKWWGCYQVVGIRSSYKGISESMLCLTGTSFMKDTALVLTENNKPLSIAGKTELKGTCFIPKAGVKAAHIEGETFWGDDFIDGAQLPAPQQLPEINPSILKQFENLSTAASNADSLLTLDQLPAADTIKNSFLSKTLRIISVGKIVLEDIKFSGNVIIQSPVRIVVRKSCVLNNVMLMAPCIEIEDEFSGTLQALASDTILAGDEVTLNYPSSLILINKPVPDSTHKSIRVPALIIGEKCRIKGTLLACIKDGNFTNSIYLKIKKEAEIMGLVYSAGYMDIQGSITGTAFAKAFILNTASGVYEQHLLNAVIDRKSLSDFFAGGIIFKGKKANKIVKWLN
ncbi:MAG TPA: hypothetical protein VNY73_08335 [Bacteroidia bacterium]|jgi:hypothetical protein|nr:hypothetical protein [Bacteroidia bacterium]